MEASRSRCRQCSGEVHAGTKNGLIHTDFPLAMRDEYAGRHADGVIGHGGPDLTIVTVNGTINLRRVSSFEFFTNEKRETRNEKRNARSSLRRPDASEQARLHYHCGSSSRARDRREHRDFQRRQRRIAAAAPYRQPDRLVMLWQKWAAPLPIPRSRVRRRTTRYRDQRRRSRTSLLLKTRTHVDHAYWLRARVRQPSSSNLFRSSAFRHCAGVCSPLPRTSSTRQT